MAAPNENTTTLDYVPGSTATYDPFAAVEARDNANMAARGVIPHDLAPGMVPAPTVQVSSEPVEPTPPPEPSSQPTQLPPEAVPPAPAAPPTPSDSPPATEPTPPASSPEPAPSAPVETAPVAPPPPVAGREQTPEERAAWARYREEEKRTKAAMVELQQTRDRLALIEQQQTQARLAEQQRQQQEQLALQGEAYQPDPVEQMQAQMAQMQQTMQQQQLTFELQTQEQAFQSQHPDYAAARDFYVQKQIEEADALGQIAVVQERALNHPVVGPAIRQAAEQAGKLTVDVARETAIQIIFQERRAQMLEGARRVGKTLPQLVYELAPRHGYQAQNGNSAAAPAAPTAAISAAEQVRQEQTAAAANSLSNVTRESSPPPPRIQTRADLETMGRTDVNALNDFIAKMDNPNRPGYDPNWLEKMA